MTNHEEKQPSSTAKNEVLCQVSAAFDEIHFEVIVPEDIFRATMKTPTSVTISTLSGDTRRATLVFDL
jgi:hypothetical protein